VPTNSSGKVLLVAVVVLLLAAGAFAAYTWASLSWSYSEGNRVGYLQKVSRKGWICKTWEGEMAMVTMPGAIPEKFFFTVRSDELATRLSGSLGRRVSVTYTQHVGVPTSCFGETEYFVHEATTLE
jgi:hypothetical protein